MRIALVLAVLAFSSCSTAARARRLSLRCERTCSAAGLEVKQLDVSRRVCVCERATD